MKRSAVFLCIFFFAVFSSFSGPFGLEMGMSLDEVTAACGGVAPEFIDDDRYIIHPMKSHPLFEDYVAWISEKNGLYYIKGVSREIRTTGYGTEIKQEFDKILSPLEKKYGRFQKINKISNDTIWRDDGDFMNSIACGARIYEAHWQALSEDSAFFDGLETLALGIKTRATYEYSKGYIWIEYGFSNQNDGFSSFDDVL